MRNKRGQVTIFIIIAMVIIVVGLLIYLIYPKVKSEAGFDSKNPSAFIQTCLEDELKENIKIISNNGGSLNPEFYYLYEDSKVEYLCYTNEDYKTCVMQQPMLKQHIESEIEASVGSLSKNCFNELKKNYEKEGENPNLIDGLVNVDLLPNKVVFVFDSVLTLEKSGERFENFKVVLNNNLYELVGIANSILEFEIDSGDADPALYMALYKDLKVEEWIEADGSTIYTLTELSTENKFMFASRSGALPPGLIFPEEE